MDSLTKLLNDPRTHKAATVVALVLSLVGIFLSVNVTTEPTPTGGKHTTVTVHFDRSGQPGIQPGTVQVPAPVVAQVQPNLESGLRNEAPAAAPQSQLDAAQRAAQQIAATQPPLPTAGATAGFIGCRTEFVRNQSSRHGVRPQLIVLHYTVSPNVPGWADVQSVVGLFNRTSAQASSHFVIDGEGHCAYIVPIEAKAWTEAAGNPFSIGIEVIDNGNESTYMQPAGLARLRSVTHQIAQRTGIPLRLGAVKGCVPTRAGIVQHKDFGLCGGGHFDITPFAIGSVVAQLAAHQAVPKKVRWARRHAQVHVGLEACRRQHRVRTPQCQQLRTRNRVYHALLARRR